MSLPTLLVTGASGHLGARVLDLLLARGGARLIATTRKPEALAALRDRGVELRRADFDDADSLAAAFQGADRALLISTDALDRPGRRREQQLRAVRALEKAGVKHVVYTSAAHLDRSSTFPIFVDHRATEDALLASSFGSTLLRNGLYTDLLLQTLPPALASGQLIDARGKGRTAFVTRDDCARAAAAALASDQGGRRAYDITGPAALDSDEIAALASALTGRPLAHLGVPAEALIAGLVQHGFPPPLAEVFAGFDVAIARGDLALTTGAVELLTGAPPQSVRAFLDANRAALGA